MSSHTRADQQGSTMGITASAATLGRIAGPLLGGIVYDAAGPQWPFAVGGVLIALGLLILAAQKRSAGLPKSVPLAAS
jgi:predicted MFS family arabinose efflux permease